MESPEGFVGIPEGPVGSPEGPVGSPGGPVGSPEGPVGIPEGSMDSLRALWAVWRVHGQIPGPWPDSRFRAGIPISGKWPAGPLWALGGSPVSPGAPGGAPGAPRGPKTSPELPLGPIGPYGPRGPVGPYFLVFSHSAIVLPRSRCGMPLPLWECRRQFTFVYVSSKHSKKLLLGICESFCNVCHITGGNLPLFYLLFLLLV